MDVEAAEAIGSGIAWAGFWIGSGIAFRYLLVFAGANPNSFEIAVQHEDRTGGRSS